MMSLFTRSLWSDHVRSPYRRLCVAFVLSPAILSVVLSIIAIVLASMAESSTEDAVSAGMDSAITLTGVIFAYTMSFGLAGVCLLWALAQRSATTWAAAGLVAGALGGFLLAEIGMDRGGRSLVIFSAVTSIALFLLMRLIAGIQDPDSDD